MNAIIRLALPGLALLLLSARLCAQPNGVHPELRRFIQARLSEREDLSPQRKARLDTLVSELAGVLSAHGHANLVFVCRENGRRGPMAHALADAIGHFYGLADRVSVFSIGARSNRVNRQAKQALLRIGFKAGMEDVPMPHGTHKLSYGPGNVSSVWSKPVDPATLNPSTRVNVAVESRSGLLCLSNAAADKRVDLQYEDSQAHSPGPRGAERLNQLARRLGQDFVYVFNRLAESFGGSGRG